MSPDASPAATAPPRRAVPAVIGVAVAASAAAVAIWELAAAPLPWALGLFVLWCGLVARRLPGAPRVLAVNAAGIAVTVIAAELALSLAGPADVRGRPAPPAPAGTARDAWVLTEQTAELSMYQQGDLVELRPGIGFVHRAGADVGERLLRGGDTLYDVRYTIGADGLRVTRSPYSAAAAAAPAVLFVGCSFTFGQGVADDETLPSAFEAAAAGAWRAVNGGTVGAGPHVILARLEDASEAAPFGPGPFRHVVYVAIRHHLARIQGEVPWTTGYPRYEVAGGALVRAGSFVPAEGVDFGAVTEAYARKSRLAAFLIDRLPGALGVADTAGAELFVAITARLRDVVTQRLGADFTVILWDDFGPEAAAVRDGLRAAGVPFLDHAEVFPDFDPLRHYLPHYPHPSAQANRELGALLAKRYSSAVSPIK